MSGVEKIDIKLKEWCLVLNYVPDPRMVEDLKELGFKVQVEQNITFLTWLKIVRDV